MFSHSLLYYSYTGGRFKGASAFCPAVVKKKKKIKANERALTLEGI